MEPSPVPTSMQQTRRVLTTAQKAPSEDKNLPDEEREPAGPGFGHSPGGLTTKIHHAGDGKGQPLAVAVAGGQRHDGVILQQVLPMFMSHALVAVVFAHARIRFWPFVLLGPERIATICGRTASEQ